MMAILIVDFHWNPDAFETMRLSTLLTYCSIISDLNRERR